MTALVAVTKRCTKCGEEKSAADFYRRRASKDGLESRCKPCKIAEVQAQQARVRAEMGDAEYRRHKAQIVRRSRLNPEVRNRTRLANRVQSEAIARLRELHRAEYEHLLAVVWSEAERGEFE